MWPALFFGRGPRGVIKYMPRLGGQSNGKPLAFSSQAQ